MRRAFRYRARSPAGVPPRLFPRGVWSLGAIRARFRGQTVQGAGVTPPTARPTSSDAPRMPVVMPADMMPGPPGSKADEASPAGTALAPAARHHPDGVPLGRDDSLACNGNRDECQEPSSNKGQPCTVRMLRMAGLSASLGTMADAANALLMLSGGPDSATLAGFVARELAAGNPPHAIYLRSGHPADKKEIAAAEQIAGRIGSRLEIVDIPELLHALQSDRLMTPSENSIVPFGNAIALSLMMLCAIRARASAHLCRLSSRRCGRERRLCAASHGSAGIVGRRSIVILRRKSSRRSCT